MAAYFHWWPYVSDLFYLTLDERTEDQTWKLLSAMLKFNKEYIF